MTVKELIERLEEFHEDLPVYVDCEPERDEIFEVLYPHLINRKLIYPNKERTDAVVIFPLN